MNKKNQQQKGVALLMVLSSIAFLTLLIVDLTFETKVNKIRMSNQNERYQARLNAEAGLNFTLVRLRMYQEARNSLQENKTASEFVKPELIQTLLTSPFMYPLPEGMPKMNLIQKNAIKDFNKDIILQGELMVQVTALSSLINPNTLRALPKPQDSQQRQESGSRDAQDKEDEKDPMKQTEARLVEMLNQAITNKSETDDAFNLQYSNLDVNLLVKELKFYVNDRDKFEDPEIAQIEPLYVNEGVIPKHGPLSSLSELYLLQGWRDEIIDLIKDQLTVHQSTVINVASLTKTQLQFLFPSLTELQIQEFFEYKNGSEEKKIEPHEIKSSERFKEIITSTLNLIPTQEYEERVKLFESAGIKLGVANNLFKVESTGKFSNSTYKITAYIEIPVREIKPPKKVKPPQAEEEGQGGEGNENPPPGQETKPDQKEEVKLLFLQPRVVEVIVN